MRVRARIPVHEPLVRGFKLKKSKDDILGTWFDFHYEKVPHFCFDCGRLVHLGGVCEPPLDSSDQWGEWLRASPGRNTSVKEGSASGAASSSNSTGSWAHHEHPRVRDVPTKRNLHSDFAKSAEHRTGGCSRYDKGEMDSRGKGHWSEAEREHDLRDDIEHRRERDLRDKLLHQSYWGQRDGGRDRDWESKGKEDVRYDSGRYADRHAMERAGGEPSMHRRPDMHGERSRRRGYYVRKPRKDGEAQQYKQSQSRFETESRKRGSKQVWVVKGDSDRYGSHDAFIRDTRRKTSAVFDRISANEDSSADPGQQGHRSQ